MPVKAAKPGRTRAAPPRILAVRASAGAGKTYQLTTRFLELLKQLTPAAAAGRKTQAGRPHALRQIAAITFTNRAAAEMKDRVILALKEIALGTPKGADLAAETGLAPVEAAAWLEAILEHFGDLQVRTIDSLIYTVMRAFAIEMGLPPELDVDFDRDAMLDRCFDRLLASISWENPGDPNRAIVMNLIEAYLTLEEAGGMVVEGMIRKRIRSLYDKACEAESRSGGQVAEPDHAAAASALDSSGRALLAAMESCGFIECFRKNEHIRDYLVSPRDHFEKAFWKRSSLEETSKKAEQFARGDLRRLDGLFEGLKTAREVYLGVHARARIYPYLRALRELRKEIRAHTESEGVVLGGNWLDMAHEFLREGGGTGSYAFLKIGSALRHFLIDEFQDTSRRQWETLFVLVEECLASGGTLFYVGDVKQAIYGWRGGDWRLFGEVLEREFPSVEPALRDEQLLDINYRSLPRIVEFNNRLYATLLDPSLGRALAGMMMPKEAPVEVCDQLAGTLAANFRDAVQRVRPKLPEDAGEGQVRVARFTGDKEDLSRGIEAALRTQVRDAWQRRAKGIAVLVRTNDQAETVATWLVAEGIPIVTENSLRLKSSPLIKGLVSFLHFLEYPLDDMAFWGALASPLFEGLETAPGSMGAFLKAGNWQRPIYRTFERTFPEMSQRLVRDLVARSGHLAPYDIVREVLDAFDVQKRFPKESVFTNRFLEVVFQAEKGQAMSLSGFLQFWDEAGAGEQVGLPEDLSAVRILTIHKAKGLEFPVVFVPFTNWTRKTDDEALSEGGELVWLRASGRVPLPVDLADLRIRTTMEDVIENVNMLYVATTRPMEELYLYVTCPLRHGRVSRLYLSAWLTEMLDAAGLSATEVGGRE